MDPTAIPAATDTMILLPLLVQVLLTVVVAGVMGVARRSSMKARGQHPNDMALAGPDDWSPAAQKAANNYKNQFELPVLFYVATLVAFVTKTGGGFVLAMAWIFVASRIVHAAVHIGPNKVTWRGSVFLAGFIAVTAMWVALARRLFMAGL